ncbi:MAG: hypothetical protein ACLFR2_04540 [Candidatus Kapaibacterium sp.]
MLKKILPLFIIVLLISCGEEEKNGDPGMQEAQQERYDETEISQYDPDLNKLYSQALHEYRELDKEINTFPEDKRVQYTTDISKMIIKPDIQDKIERGEATPTDYLDAARSFKELADYFKTQGMNANDLEQAALRLEESAKEQINKDN